MAFFPAPDSWRDEVVVQAGSVVRLLDSIPDEIGTQMLINTGAALTRMTPSPGRAPGSSCLSLEPDPRSAGLLASF
jgi:hypothetical protein